MKKIISFNNKINFPVVPVMFSLSFVLSSFYNAMNEIYIQSIFLPLLVFTAFSILIYYFFRLFLKDSFKTSIFTSLFLVLFLSYDAVSTLDWSFNLSFGKLSIGKVVFQIILYFLIIFWLLLKFKKSKKDFSKAYGILTKIGLVAVLIPLILIAYGQIRRMILPPARSPLVLPKITEGELNKNNLPDIYFILPEDDSSPSVYKQYFNVDESNFVSFLNSSGFYVADKSTSNYPKTFQSLASMLNMEYLDYLSSYTNSPDMTIVDPLIENNNVIKFLKKHGYKYYHLGSWWDPTKFNPLADNNFTVGDTNKVGLDPFYYDLADATMFSPLLDKILPQTIVGFSDDDNRERIIYQFEKLNQIVNLPGPKFVFAHIIAPHGPYVFGKNCEFITSDVTSNLSDKDNYINENYCVNQKLEATIKTIISTSKRPPIILLQTDEGAPFLNQELNPEDNWKSASTSLLKQKFPILAAYYLPGVSKDKLYPTITPVNSFRLIFNLYFSTNFQLLPDKNYIFQDLQNLYQFIDVTNKLK